MTIHFTSFILCFFSIFVVLLSASPNLVFNLIHPKKINSLDHPHASRYEEATIARQYYLQAKARGDIIAHIFPSIPTAFLINVSIGNPPVMQLLHMDTGSDLTWLQCHPCTNCYRQNTPIFDPSKSSTYSNIFGYCGSNRLHYNARTRSCEYSVEYMDNSGSKGTLGRETFTFNTIYGELSTASLANTIFGCGNDNFGNHVGTCIFGLGFKGLSLVHMFGSKFSYCFGSLDDTSSNPQNHVLVIGDNGNNFLGDTTPLTDMDGLYYIKMEQISVDGIFLSINPSVFQQVFETGLGGTIIDTGSSNTYLVAEAYQQLKNKIEDIFDRKFMTFFDARDEVQCYYGNLDRDVVESGFPTITFHFADGTQLSLDVNSVFSKKRSNQFCLAIALSSDRVNIIGARAQQNYNIGYDIKESQLFIERIDCGVVFDY